MADSDDGPALPSVDELTAEVERLRRLVGVDEKSYVELLADVERARAAARSAEHEAGRARAETARFSADMQRARAAQDAAERRLDELEGTGWRTRIIRRDS